jgi:hypothetical protein
LPDITVSAGTTRGRSSRNGDCGLVVCVANNYTTPYDASPYDASPDDASPDDASPDDANPDEISSYDSCTYDSIPANLSGSVNRCPSPRTVQ